MGRYLRVAAIILVAVLLAGCTALEQGQDTDSQDEQERLETPNDGLDIAFSPISSTVQENEVLQFNVRVRNSGGTDADIQALNVFGSTFLDLGGRCQQMSRISTGTTLRPGSSEEFTWKCDAPLGGEESTALVDLQEGATDTFSAGMEMEYGYETTARTSVKIATPSRFTRSSAVRTENTAGPVHAKIDLRSPQSAPEGGSDASLRVPVTVRNVGDGEVTDAGVDITVSVDGEEQKERTVQLVDGSRREIISLSGFGLDEGELEKTVDISVAMEYTYRERVSSPFTIQGQPPGVQVEVREDAEAPGDVPAAEPEGLQFVVGPDGMTKRDYNLTVVDRHDLRLDTFRIWVNEDGAPEDGRSVDCAGQDGVDPANDQFTCEFAVGSDGKQYPEGTRFKAVIESRSGDTYEVSDRIDFDESSTYQGSGGVIGIRTEPRTWEDEDDDGVTDDALVFQANISPQEYSRKLVYANFSSREGGGEFGDTCTVEAVMEAGDEETDIAAGSGFQQVDAAGYAAGEERPEVRAVGYTCRGLDVACIPTPLVATPGDGAFTAEPTCYSLPLTFRARVEQGGEERDHGRVVLKNDSHPELADRDMPADFGFPLDTDNGTVLLGAETTFATSELYGCEDESISLRLQVSGDAWESFGREDVADSTVRKDLSCGEAHIEVSASSGTPVPYGTSFEFTADARSILRGIQSVEIAELYAESDGETEEFGPVTCDDASSCTATIDSIPPRFSGGSLHYRVVVTDAQGGETTEEAAFSIEQ